MWRTIHGSPNRDKCTSFIAVPLQYALLWVVLTQHIVLTRVSTNCCIDTRLSRKLSINTRACTKRWTGTRLSTKLCVDTRVSTKRCIDTSASTKRCFDTRVFTKRCIDTRFYKTLHRVWHRKKYNYILITTMHSTQLTDFICGKRLAIFQAFDKQTTFLKCVQYFQLLLWCPASLIIHCGARLDHAEFKARLSLDVHLKALYS